MFGGKCDPKFLYVKYFAILSTFIIFIWRLYLVLNYITYQCVYCLCMFVGQKIEVLVERQDGGRSICIVATSRSPAAILDLLPQPGRLLHNPGDEGANLISEGI